MSKGPVPITVTSKHITNLGDPNGLISNGYNGYGYTAPIGYNHRGTEDIERVVMSLKCGIESEVKWALSTLTRVSVHPTLVLEEMPFVGHELIKFFIRPFHLILEQKPNKVTQTAVSFSLDSLLTLRNLAQDLPNQQWLSQIKPLKKHIIEVLRYLFNWFYSESKETYALKDYENQFREALTYLLDLLEPLSCYYIDNSKNDPLFAVLLNASVVTKDKALFVSVLKSLSHLLIVREKTAKDEESAEEGTVERVHSNCIDSIKETHLESYIDQLLINDNELALTVLDFIRSYLTSEALHPDFPKSVKDSQLYRLQYLLQLNTSKSSFNTLVRQLPLLILSNLPLNDSSNFRPISQLNLTKRSHFSGVPSTLPDLPPDLYSLIVRFPEPLRATTWLRCCYEPYTHQVAINPESADVIPGEVTQISLWKAYEKQFQEIWDSADGKSHPEYKSLLPAVDFIKNVSHAFPNSEAMVVNLEPVLNDPPKKKFIIKGIQPRQFAVNIDVGNYEALKTIPISSINPSENFKLPIGHIEPEKFDHALNNLSETILSSSISKSSESVTDINLTAHELLEYIIDEVLETKENSPEENIFRLYNSHWLPETVYANPSLVEGGLIDSKWLKYLV